MFDYIKNNLLVLLLIGFLGITSSISPVADTEKRYDNAIVMFYTSSCPYCKYMLPVMSQIQREYGNKINIIFIEISRNQTFYKTEYGFRTVPTIIYFKDGKEMARHGSNNKTVTVTFIKNNIAAIWGI